MIRSNSAVRIMQKKLRKILKELLKQDDMRSLLESTNEKSPEMLIFHDDIHIDKYGEDVFAFKTDAEKGFKHLSKIHRGKRKECADMSALFHEMLEQDFPELFVTPPPGSSSIIVTHDTSQESGRKRSRSSVSSSGNTHDEAVLKSEVRSEKKVSRVSDSSSSSSIMKKEEANVRTTLPSKIKADLKYIVNKIIKTEDAESFVYPVDAKLYPEYFVTIEQPMDLSTVRTKLSDDQYQSVGDALVDLRLIWDNCRTFNAEGSDILNSAEICAVLLEELVQEKFGDEYVLKKKKPTGRDRSSSKQVKRVSLSASGDEETAETAAVLDLRKDSSSSSSSRHRKKEEVKEALQTGTKSSSSRATSTAAAGRPVPDNFPLRKTAMKAILQEVCTSSFAEPFLSPVDMEEAPGYSDLIDHPMDLGTMRKRVISGLYDNSPAEFMRDTRLIWHNCALYNDPNSQIVSWAYKVRDIFEEQLQLAMVAAEKETKDAVGDTVVVAAPPAVSSKEVIAIKREVKSSSKDAAGASKDARSKDAAIVGVGKDSRSISRDAVASGHKAVRNDSTTQQHSEAPTSTTEMDSGGANGAGKDAVKRRIKLKLEEKGPVAVDSNEQGRDDDKKSQHQHHSNNTIRKLKKMWREVYHHDLAPPFQYPVPVKDVPGYMEIVKNPIDLSTIKNKIASYEDSPSTFLTDMCLIFDNCQLFNLENSELYKAAGVLRAFTEQRFNETFTSSSSRRRSSSSTPRNKSRSDKAGKSDAVAAAANAAVKGEDGAGGRSVSSSPMKGANEKKHAVDAEHEHDLLGHSSKPSGQSKSNTSGPTAVAATVSSSSSSSAKGSIQSISMRYPDTVPELNELIARIEEARGNYSSNEFVRDRCFRQAADLLVKTKVPFTVAPQLYVVKRFGNLFPGAPISDCELLNPIGYTCSRSLRLCVVSDSYQQDLTRSSFASSSASSSKIPFVTVDLKSSVEMTGSNAVWFSVTLENGTGISRCKSPKEAWIDALGKEASIVRALGSKLRRCRAVFNRMCVSPDAPPFLEQVPITGSIGTDYYKAITAPMWLREVHSRLADGTYDVEYDFAWDVRLIFKNCMEYNSVDSELFQCAVRLSQLFELLFLNWVINVQDKSVDELAVGTWDDWYHLRYFDATDPSENICAATSTKGPASLMLQCRHCDDQNLQSLHPKVPAGSKDWVCLRCSDALEQTLGDLSGKPFINTGSKSLRNIDSYSCEIFGGHWFVPAPELGAGWSQARRKQKSGLKNWFLSPLGYEVTSREDAASQSSYEEEINQNLYDARATEFQAQQSKSNNKSSSSSSNHHPVNDAKKQKTARHKRKRNEEYQSPEKVAAALGDTTVAVEESTTIDFGRLEDEGRICTGKLHNFMIPDGFQLKWFVCSDETEIISRFEQNLDISDHLDSLVPLDTDALPPSGYFGLELPAIRSRMEGLEHSISCKQYRYIDAVRSAELILDELRSASRRLKAINSSQEKLNQCLLKERWKLERELVYPAVPPAYFSNIDKPLPHKVGFRELFPSLISSDQGELLLSLWEYLYQNHVTSKATDTLSLHDLISSLIPSGSVLPNYGQVVFDEVCCMLVDLLYLQIRKNVSHIFQGAMMTEECQWNSTMAVRPLNVFTWPHLALEAIRTLAFPLLPMETSKVLERPLNLAKCPQRDMLCLLFNHPLIDQFLVLVSDDHVHSQSLNAASGTLRFMKDFFSNPDVYNQSIAADDDDVRAELQVFNSIGPFSSALKTLFRDISTIEGMDDTRRLFSANILSWLNDLCKRWDIIDDTSTSDLGSGSSQQQLIDVDSLVFNSKRFWGGYTLSGISVAKDDLLLPHCFSRVQRTQYAEKMSMLLMLEKCLLLMSKSEPDDWSTADRAVVYAVLLDHCITVSDYTAPQIARYEQTTKKLHQVDDIPIAPSKVVDLPIIDVHKTVGGSDPICYFSGLSFSAENSIKWVNVPAEYQYPNDAASSTNSTPPGVSSSSASSQSTKGDASSQISMRESRSSNAPPSSGSSDSAGSVRAAPMALLTVMCRLIAARELAAIDASRYEERVMNTIRNTLSEDPKTSSLHRHINGRGGPSSFFLPSLLSQPLGFDRNGSSYWLLSVQEHSTVFPYTTSGQASLRAIGTNPGTPSLNNVIEPCVLIREPSGWWGFHSGADLKALFDSFSVEVPHEKRLRLRMIERMAMTRCLLRKGTLFVNLLQREWIDRRSRCETWIQNQTKIPDSMTIQQKTLFIELMWARCVEVRQFMHFSGVYRYEEDPLNQSSVRAEREGLQRKQKKLRDSCLEDSFDLHPTRGWRRDDPLTSIRTIAASCTATRLIADPSIYQIYQQVTRRSVVVFGKRMYPLLEKNILPPPSTIAPTASDDPLQPPAAATATATCNVSASTSAPDGGNYEQKPLATITTTLAVATMDVEKPDAAAAAPSVMTIGTKAMDGEMTDPGAQIASAVGGSDASVVGDDIDDHSMLDAEDLIDDPMDVEEIDDDAIQFMINNEEDISQSMVVSEETQEIKTKSDAPIEGSVESVDLSSKALNTVVEGKSDIEMEVQDDDDANGGLIQAQAAIDVVDRVMEISVVDTDEATPHPPSDDTPAEEIEEEKELSAVVPEAVVERAVVVEEAVVEDKFPFVDSNGLAILPNLKMLISSESSGRPYPPNIRCKSIELLHLITGEVVQIFPAGKDAATYFGISQSGISLCLHDIKPDYYGFKWKVYDGPVINFPYLSRFQFPHAAILQMQVTKQQRVDHYSIEDERRRVAHVLKQMGWTPNLQGLEVGSLFKSQPIVPQSSSSNSIRPPPRNPSTIRPVTINGTTPSSTTVALSHPRSSYPDPSIAALTLKNIVTSTEIQSARFLRLKGELLNILYILPEKLLRLPDLDEEGEKAITAAGEEAAANIRQGVLKLSNSSNGGAMKKTSSVPTDMDTVDSGVKKDGASDAKAASIQSGSKVALADRSAATTTTSKHSDDEVEKVPSSTDMSISNVERLADKAARKAKRRLRRKLSMDRFLKNVQTAVTPQQLMDVTLCLEDAIPVIHTYKMTKSALPATALTLGAVAIRIFALDRMIAYDELKGIDSVASQCSHRLRTYFYPRCMQSSSCRGFLCHNSKCLHNFEPSRIPDIVQGTTATTSYPLPNFGSFQRPNNPQLYSRASNSNPSNTLSGDPQRRVSYAPVLPNRPKDEELPLSEILIKLRSFRKEIDVETIQPYVPVFGQDLDTTEWV